MKVVSVVDETFEEQALFSIPDSMSISGAEALFKIAVEDSESFLEDEAQEFLRGFGIERFLVMDVITV